MAEHDPERFGAGDPTPKANEPRCLKCGGGVFRVDELVVGLEQRENLSFTGGMTRTQLICEACGEPLAVSVRWRRNRRVF